MSRKFFGINAVNALANPLSGRDYLIWLVVGLLIAVFPVLVIQHLPLADYPNHLARVFVWLVNDTEQKVPNLKVIWALQPNMAFDLIVGGLAQVISLEAAGRVFIVMTIMSMVLGPAILSRTIYGSFSWANLLAFLFVYNRIFYWGFLGYLFSLGLAIALSALWVCYEPKKHFLLGYPARGIAALIILGCHLYAFGILCLLVIFLTVRELNLSQLKKTPGMVAKNFVLKVIPLALPLPLFLLFSPAFELGRAVSWRSMLDKVYAGAGVLIGLSTTVDFAAAGVVSLMLAWILVSRKIRMSPLSWAFVGFLILLHLAMPNQLFSSFGADRRLPIAIALIACALLVPARSLSRATAMSICVVFTVVLAVRAGGLVQQWKAADEVYGHHIEAYQQLPRKSNIIYLVGTTNRMGLPTLPLTEYAGYAMIERSVFWPGIFAYPVNGAQTIAFNPVAAGMSAKAGFQKIPLGELHAVLAGELPLEKFSEMPLLSCFDYAVVAMEDLHGMELPSDSIFGTRIYNNKFVSIYRIKRVGVCPWGKE